MKLLNKKGQAMTQLQAFILGVVGVAITLAVGVLVLVSLQTSVDPTSSLCTGNYTYNTTSGSCTNITQGGGAVAVLHSNAYNATGSIVASLATVPTWVGIVIVVALAFIVLGFFYLRGQNM